ncbi:MAG: hypothetical protein ACP5D2_03035 [Candidatus Nanoarchaeia archaeon]
MIDAQNRLWHHSVIAILSALFFYTLYLSDIRISQASGIVAFFILSLVMIIGPLAVLLPAIARKTLGDFPWSWRAELGIWFAIWSIIHFLILLNHKEWDILNYISGLSPWGFGSLIAVIMAIVLAILSFRKAIAFLGTESWKWIQNYFTYVIWWLLVLHIIWAFKRAGFPPSTLIHWTYLIIIILIPILQIAGFIKIVSQNKKADKEQ